jgi:acetoacetyl-CoA synthetase
MGSSEIYSAVESLPEVADSLVIGVERERGGYYMPLFVVLREGSTLDDALRNRIAARIRETLSPRHVPDEILAVPSVPRTLNGKKLEVPIKRLFQGAPLEQAVNPDAVANPDALAHLAALAARSPR